MPESSSQSCHGTVGNELTTAVQLIAFLKKQISNSKRPEVHEYWFNWQRHLEQKENFLGMVLLTTTPTNGVNTPCRHKQKELFTMRVINSPCYHNKELASPEQTATELDWILNSPAEVVPKSVAGSSFPAASSTLLPSDVQFPTGRVVVPTGRSCSSCWIDYQLVRIGIMHELNKEDIHAYQSHAFLPRENTFGCKKNLWKEERVRLLVGSPGVSTTPIYSPGSSSTPIYSPGSSTPPCYSPGASTPPSYSLGTSRNAECSNCKYLLDKITVL
ncbi:hypothetical protein Tco_0648265 [Tanacetum coccineum]